MKIEICPDLEAGGDPASMETPRLQPTEVLSPENPYAMGALALLIGDMDGAFVDVLGRLHENFG